MLGLNLSPVERPHGRGPRAAPRSPRQASAPPGRRRRSRHGAAPGARGRRLDRGPGRLRPGGRLAPPHGAGVRRGQRQPGGRGPGGRSRRRGRPAAVRQPRRQAARPLGRAERGADRPRPVDHGVARGVPRLSRRGRAAQPLGPRRGRARPPAGHSDRHHVRARVLQARAHARLARRHRGLDRRRRHRARHRLLRQPARARPDRHQRLPRLPRRRVRRRARGATSSSSRATRRTPTPGTAWARPGSTTPPARTQAPHWTQAIRAFKRTLALDPGLRAGVRARAVHAGQRGGAAPLLRAGGRRIRSRWPRRPTAGRCWTAPPPAAAVRRARAEALATARSWVASQPTTLRAHGAMVDAYIASGNYGGGTRRGGSLPADARRCTRSCRSSRPASASPRAKWTAPPRSFAPRSTPWRRRTSGRYRGHARRSWATSPPRPTCSPIRATSPARPRPSTSPTRCAAR